MDRRGRWHAGGHLCFFAPSRVISRWLLSCCLVSHALASPAVVWCGIGRVGSFAAYGIMCGVGDVVSRCVGSGVRLPARGAAHCAHLPSEDGASPRRVCPALDLDLSERQVDTSQSAQLGVKRLKRRKKQNQSSWRFYCMVSVCLLPNCHVFLGCE